MNKYCVHCGTALREEMLFCPNCGTKKEKQEEMATAEILHCQNEAENKSTDIRALAKKAYAWVAEQVSKRKKVLLICGVVIAVVVAISLIFGGKGDAPFFGIERGDSVQTVEKKLGTPDDFDDNGSQNYRYYYYDIKFLNMEGYLDIHFLLDKVDNIHFEDSWASMDDYEDAVEYYTKQYGEPSTKYSDYSDYYSESECAIWDLDNGNAMRVEYYGVAQYESPTLTIYVYN